MGERSTWRRAGRRLRVIQSRTDELATVERIETDTGKRVACAEGCAHCCRQLPTASMPEAIAIAMRLADDRDALDRVRQRLEPQVMRLLATRTSAEDWFELQLDCVLLERERCLAHELRPTACRTLFALETSERCAHGASDPNVVRVDLSEVRRRAVGDLLALAHELRLPLAQLPLPLALEWALVVVEHGLEALQARLAGTMFADDLRTAVFWAERLHRSAS